MIRVLFAALLILFASPALAADFPPLSGRVVDQADLLNPAQEAQLSQRLEALERASSRQLVVVTVSSLDGLTVEDYGYELGRRWALGNRDADNGAILLIALNERKMRIEVGQGLEGIMTDALSGQIIRNVITPHFRASPPDYAGGILAGADSIIAQFQAPPEAAEQRAVQAAQAERQQQSRNRGGSPFPFIIWMVVIFFILLPMIGRGMAGRRYRRGVSIWGPGDNRGSGLGWFLAGVALDSLNHRSGGGSSWSSGGGSSWGGGGSSWGGGGGGFSGGGGSFGGGGASGGW